MDDLYKYFNIPAKEFWFNPKYKAGIWDGRIPFMHKNGLFGIGLLDQVIKFVRRDDLDISVDKQLVEKIESDDFTEVTEQWLNEEWIPRPHQIKGAKLALRNKRCILEHATSSGKSLTIAMVAMYRLLKGHSQKVLILVPNLGLIEQMINDFTGYGIPPEDMGRFSGKVKDTEQKIIVSTWQSLVNNKKLASTFDTIICDETHGLKAKVVREVAESVCNADVRIGCTGTMPDDKSEKMLITSMLGPVIHQISAKYLIDNKLASDISIKIVYIKYPKSYEKKIKNIVLKNSKISPTSSTFNCEKEKNFIEDNTYRTGVINEICKKHTDKEHNVLILINKKDHGKYLYDHISKGGTVNNVFYIDGDMNIKERERIRQYANKNKGVIMIATSGVFSIGISINRLHAIIFAEAGKSKIRTLQSVGRGLRLHTEKKKFILYDIGDSFKYSEKHLEGRLKMYAKAEFPVDIIELEVKDANI